MKLKNSAIFISLIFFFLFLSFNYSYEISEQKSQGKIKKEKQAGKNYFKEKPSLPSKGKTGDKKIRSLENKLRDLFTLDEVSPIKGFLKKLRNILSEQSEEYFDNESSINERKGEKKKSR